MVYVSLSACYWLSVHFCMLTSRLDCSIACDAFVSQKLRLSLMYLYGLHSLVAFPLVYYVISLLSVTVQPCSHILINIFLSSMVISNSTISFQ